MMEYNMETLSTSFCNIVFVLERLVYLNKYILIRNEMPGFFCETLIKVICEWFQVVRVVNLPCFKDTHP